MLTGNLSGVCKKVELLTPPQLELPILPSLSSLHPHNLSSLYSLVWVPYTLQSESLAPSSLSFLHLHNLNSLHPPVWAPHNPTIWAPYTPQSELLIPPSLSSLLSRYIVWASTPSQAGVDLHPNLWCFLRLNYKFTGKNIYICRVADGDRKLLQKQGYDLMWESTSPKGYVGCSWKAAHPRIYGSRNKPL